MYNVYLLLLFFSFLSNKENKGPNVLRETINRIDLNIPYTREKIEVLKKIGPYFPQEYIPAINKALIFTERFIKLYEAVEFIRSNESIYIKQSIPVNSNQERFNYIARYHKKGVFTGQIKSKRNCSRYHFNPGSDSIGCLKSLTHY